MPISKSLRQVGFESLSRQLNYLFKMRLNHPSRTSLTHWSVGFRWSHIFLTFILLFNLSFAGDLEQNDAKKNALAKPSSVFDRAIGFMDAGKINVIGVENFGLLSGWDPPATDWYPGAVHGSWGEIRWIAPVLTMPPGPWGRNITNQDGITEDRSNQYNTLESFSSIHLHQGDGINFTDWEPKDNSATHYFGSATESGIPMIAVSTLEESWPEGYYDSTGVWQSTPSERHWPGPWALDPDPDSETFNQPLENTFVSDQDIFFVMDDKYNGIRSGATTAQYGYPVGIDIETSGYSYSSIWYDDVVFFNMNIIFRTFEDLNDADSPFYDPDRNFYNGTIDSMYFAFFVDPDMPGAFLENSRQAYPWAEDDYASVEDIDGDGKIDVCLMYDKQDYFTDYSNGNEGPVSSYGVHFFKTPRQDPSDPNSPEVGITGFHWFDQDDVMRNHEINADWEKVLYTLCSGESENLAEEERLKWFHDLDGDNIDELATLQAFQESYPVGNRPDIQFWFSSGPFSISPGDTIPIHIGIVGGHANPGGYDASGFPLNDAPTRFKDAYENLFTASALYQSNFIGAKPPKTPTLTASGTLERKTNELPVYHGEDGKVTLFWDNIAESSRDLISKELDFEGYRIYRTIVNYSTQGETDWGDEIYNYNGEIMGYKPIAQFDLDNGWSGFDPYNQYFDLGLNSGLSYSFVDHDVINGMRYRYAITAYDHPFDSLKVGSNESFIGIDSRSINIIDIIPGSQPYGHVGGQVEIEHLTGNGTGNVFTQLVDAISIQDNNYELIFDESQNDLQFTVMDSSNTIVSGPLDVHSYSAYQMTPDYYPAFNGVQLAVESHDSLRFLSKAWDNGDGEESGLSFSDLMLAQTSVPRAGEYAMVFGDSTLKYPVSYASKVPFQIFNTLDDPDMENPLLIGVGPSSSILLPWQSGEIVQILEGDSRSRTWYYQVFWDSLAVIPSNGEIFRFNTTVPFTAQDTFSIVTHEASIKTADEDYNIKVVPNPYIVSSITERQHPDALTTYDLRFTHLPPHCDIHIHTVNGDLVKSIRHDSESVGEEHWNMLTEDHMEISHGVYFYIVIPDDGPTFQGKFAVIW